MKRKAETEDQTNGRSTLKKKAKTILPEEEVYKSFRQDLFAQTVLDKYTKAYAESQPYKHGVISSLVDDSLLRSVRQEICENIHFTMKETDIYRIHQSGDLANLDGLDNGALESLPSLLRLRDVLYSSRFREYIAKITGSGELSGRKTDMAINVYTPGCHLLCHDDVIGSRRVSYIFYLTDPEVPWKEEWGGGLRLYPTKTINEDNGEMTKTPSPDFDKIIPPAWNQLSFFAVQPGESFHDVEEVYHASSTQQLIKDGGRIRIAISGWYHIPQIGEEGYVKGAEQKWGAKSSLMQLQGHPDRYDLPPSQPKGFVENNDSSVVGLEAEDLEFLLKYMAPGYLTPDILEEIGERFGEESGVTLNALLSDAFATKIRKHIEAQEKTPCPRSSIEIEKGSWRVAKPPHKHRFLYLPPLSAFESEEVKDLDPLRELTEVFLSSRQFRQWLEIATQCRIEDHDLLARRFRRGLDYALATGHEGKARLEIGLGLTPTVGWVSGDDDGSAGEEAVVKEADVTVPSTTNGKRKREESDDKDHMQESSRNKAKNTDDEVTAPELNQQQPVNGNSNTHSTLEQDKADFGGHEIYMVVDDNDPSSDAAIYKGPAPEAEEDNVLLATPTSWNTLTIVLRDCGILKFVKYVSQAAPGDRWDITGSFGVGEFEEPEDADEAEAVKEPEEAEESETVEGPEKGEDWTGQKKQVNGNAVQAGLDVSLEDSEAEVFNGFPHSEDSDSD